MGVSICDNIKRFRTLKGWSQQQIADMVGEKRSTYAEWERNTVPKADILLKIANILGVELGELLATDEKSDNRSDYLKDRQKKKNDKPKKKQIPFYDAPAQGGVSETDMTPIHAPAGTIDVGDLLNDSEAAIRIYGNSMLPNYPPGCVVGLIKCDSLSIEPGETYVIETRTRRILKRLFYPGDKPSGDRFMCISDNTMKFEGGARDGQLAYPAFEMEKKEIKSLYVVSGVIKRNANSIIINR